MALALTCVAAPTLLPSACWARLQGNIQTLLELRGNGNPVSIPEVGAGVRAMHACRCTCNMCLIPTPSLANSYRTTKMEQDMCVFGGGVAGRVSPLVALLLSLQVSCCRVRAQTDTPSACPSPQPTQPRCHPLALALPRRPFLPFHPPIPLTHSKRPQDEKLWTMAESNFRTLDFLYSPTFEQSLAQVTASTVKIQRFWQGVRARRQAGSLPPPSPSALTDVEGIEVGGGRT